ncbi:MAG: IS110 family transposase [Methanothrix sp.]|nr:IS110 family transposase [Methanothrix sp.]
MQRSEGTCHSSPRKAHLASWAGICPGNNESAQVKKSKRCQRAVATSKQLQSGWLGRLREQKDPYLV